MRMISDTLAKSAHQRQGLAQSAMNAAAGGNMNGMVNGQGMANMNGGQGQSPQLYAQMLRQQQDNQQKAQAQAAAQAAAAQNQQANNGQGHQRSSSAASGK
jgi:chromatin modification-related protein VID21